ncbi:MAG: DNA polymerase, partial [Erysipelotrichaceae bacterium]
MAEYVADFETTTTTEDCHVWAYAICDIDNPENVTIGTTIDEFMDWCKSQKTNDKVYFHNLKFDGQFIMYWLFKHGYTHTTLPEDKKSNTFNTLISDKGLYYQIEVIFNKKGKRINKVIFQDSLKLIPLSVDGIAKAFKLPISKLEID